MHPVLYNSARRLGDLPAEPSSGSTAPAPSPAAETYVESLNAHCVTKGQIVCWLSKLVQTFEKNERHEIQIYIQDISRSTSLKS